MTDPTPNTEPTRRRGRGAVIALGLMALLLVGGYAAAVVTVSGQDVPAGTVVRGVDVGGMSAEQAAATLQTELGGSANAPIPVTAGEATTEILPAESGLGIDWDATVAQGTGLILNPVALWTHLTEDVVLEPVTTVDADALAASLETLADVAAVEPTEPHIRFTKKAAARLELGKPGSELDVPGSVDVVSMAYYQLPTRTLDLPMDPVAPTVTDETATTVFEEFAEPAVAAPVKVRITDPTDDDFKARTVMVEPTEIAPTLSFDVEDGTLEPAMNSEELIKAISDDLDGLERSGRNARIVIRSGKPVVVRSLTGRTLDEEEVADGVFAVLPETTATARTVKVALSVKQPRFTTKDAKALKIKEKLSSFRQYFPPAQYRYVNVGRAAEYLNGTILEPGDTFSMNETIKERTPANGYTEGYIISGGRFREDLGGGVSIITTATWTAGFYAGLERVEQHPHGLYISRYKAGLEATVAWGYLDLKMRNDTGNGVLITATRYSDGVLIEMWGTKKYDKVTATFSDRYNYTDFQKVVDNSDECVASEGVRGFSISVTRRRYIDGKVASKETWPTIYKPTPNVVCTSPRASG